MPFEFRGLCSNCGYEWALRWRTDDYRRARQARAKLVRWQRQMLALVDAIA